SSPDDLAPVFQTMLDNAMRVCQAQFGHLSLIAGENSFRMVAVRRPTAAIEAERSRQYSSYQPDSDAPIARASATKQVVHVEDFRTEPAYLRRSPPAVRIVELDGARTTLAVPLLK